MVTGAKLPVRYLRRVRRKYFRQTFKLTGVGMSDCYAVQRRTWRADFFGLIGEAGRNA